jgi:oligopeptide/dipeptide ABC transporter ATP-binding protein
MQRIRGNRIAMIFQEPMTSLNPVYTIGQQIMEAVQLHQRLPRTAALDVAERALRDVGIAEPRRRLDEYPHQMSGGMRQRVMIAMALACEPELLLADEPTTALDVTIQAQILELLRELQQKRGMSIMLITHDLGVVAENADVVAVMYAGRIVEYGSVTEIFAHPMHPYTRGLFSSIPKLADRRARLTTILDQKPDSSVLPAGYQFTPPADAPREPVERFPILQTLDADESNVMTKFLRDTATRSPQLYELKREHWVSCWRTDGGADEHLTRPDLAFRREAVAASR